MQEYRRTAIIVLLTLVTLVVVAFGSKPADKDFISFWSAGQLLAHHQNPYDRTQVLAVEREEGYTSAKPIIMRNPPWALPLMYPLGHLSARFALVAWMLAAMASVLLCLRVYPVAAPDRIFAFLFAPVYACLASGQSSAFLLLGFLLFLVLHRKLPLLAGASLVLMVIKPHLFLVLLPVMVLDLVRKRELRVLAGAAMASIGACAFAIWLDPHVWADYGTMLRTSSLDSEFLQTPSYLIRFLIAPHAPWVQLVPSALALTWSVRYYLKRRDAWDLRVNAIPLLFVSLLASPYAWFTDEVMLLPALLFVLASGKRARHTARIFLSINTAALVLLFAQFQLSSGAFVWTSTAWAALYFYNRTQGPVPDDESELSSGHAAALPA